MKGHTKIELTNEETGEKKILEEDNMITKALELYLAAGGIGGSTGNLLSDQAIMSQPAWQTLVGGLMLFGSRLEENANNVLPNAGIQMIGNGAYGKVSNDEVTEMGSYNEKESGPQPDGSLKIVWDFTTSQANGTIHCACLSSVYGGTVGAGNAASGKYKNEGEWIHKKNIGRPDEEVLEKKDINDNDLMLSAVWEENSITYIRPRTIFYISNQSPEQHWYNTGQLELVTMRYGMQVIDLLEKIKMDRVIYTTSVAIPAEIKNHVESQNNVNNYMVASNGTTGYILFHNKKRIEANDDFYILKIDKALETKIYKMKNNSGAILNIKRQSFAVTSDGYAVLISAESPYDVYKIKLEDNTEIKKIENIIKSDINFKLMSNDRIFTSDVHYFIDTKREQMLCMNRNVIDNIERGIEVSGNPLLVIENSTPSRSSAQAFMHRRNDYLATINNLEEPVIKTPEKTMKVTYTLTF